MVATRTDKKTNVRPDYDRRMYFITGKSGSMKLKSTPRRGLRGARKTEASLGKLKRDPKRMYFAKSVRGKLVVKSFRRKNA